MKRTILTIGFISLVAALLVSSCIYIDGSSTSYYYSFDYALQGTWETQPGFPYNNVTVVINYDTIRIEDRYIIRPKPLSDFTANSTLKGYSTPGTLYSNDLKEGSIYIKDRGFWQEPIQYRYWVTEFPEYEKRLILWPGNITLYYKYP